MEKKYGVLQISLNQIELPSDIGVMEKVTMTRMLFGNMKTKCGEGVVIYGRLMGFGPDPNLINKDECYDENDVEYMMHNDELYRMAKVPQIELFLENR